MTAIAESVKATMTGWQADNADQEAARLLARPSIRSQLPAAPARQAPLKP
jgi:hypothetical protein